MTNLNYVIVVANEQYLSQCLLENGSNTLVRAHASAKMSKILLNTTYIPTTKDTHVKEIKILITCPLRFPHLYPFL